MKPDVDIEKTIIKSGDLDENIKIIITNKGHKTLTLHRGSYVACIRRLRKDD